MLLGYFIVLLFNNMQLYVGISAVICIVYYLIFRRYIFSFFDPIFFLVIVSSAFATSTVFFLYFTKNMTDYYFFNYVLSLVVYYGVFVLLGRKIPKKYVLLMGNHNKRQYLYPPKISGIFFVVFFIFSLLHIVFQLFLYLKTGIPLFMDSRLEVNLSGGPLVGFIIRVLDGISLISSLMVFYVFFFEYGYKRFYAKIYFTFILITLVLSGSKGAIISEFFLFSTFVYFTQDYNQKAVDFMKGKRMIKLLVFAIIFLIGLLVIRYHGSLFNAIQSLFIRFAAFGDGYVYSYNDEIMNKIEKVDFLHLLFNDIVNTFRLNSKPRSQGLGFEILSLVMNTKYVTGGPNPRFNIVGLAYFGVFGNIIIAFFSGAIFTLCRNLYVEAPRKSIGVQLVSYYIYSMASSIETDLCVVISRYTTNILLQSIIFIYIIIIVKYCRRTN